MKNTLLYLPIVVGFLFRLAVAAPVTLELSPAINGADGDGQASFVLELTRAELGNREGFELVDRSDLQKALDELGLIESELATRPSEVQRLGKLVGARYFCSASSLSSGDQRMISVRVVQVGTSVYKLAVLQLEKEPNLKSASEELAVLIAGKIAELEKRPELTKPLAEPVVVPADLKRPVVAVLMLETSFANRPGVDPASEIRLIERLGKQGFKTVQLSQRGQSVQPGENRLLEGQGFEDYLKDARASGVDVVIMGEAFSETADRIGRVVSSRARVEVHVIRVSDKKVIHATKGYGAASDVAELTAGKKAIEAATDAMCVSLPLDVATGWTTEGENK